MHTRLFELQNADVGEISCKVMGPRCASTALESDEEKNYGINILHDQAYAGFFTVPGRERDRFVGSSIDEVRSQTAAGVKTVPDGRGRERRK